MDGWVGKILFINLNDSEVREADTGPYAEKYLGGRGIGTGIYWEQVAPLTKAFDPENTLTLMTGPLVGTGTQGATRMAVVAKSPMTFPEGFCYGNIGGFFPSHLKRAGYDGIVIQGRARTPVYLWISNGRAEIREASSLWGRGTYATGNLLREVHGEKTHYLAIGRAGESLVRSAIIMASHESASTGGFGAVMGSKNLKAIAVAGSGKISVAKPDKLKGLNKYAINMGKRVRLSMPPDVISTGHTDLLEVIGKGGCYQCAFECIRGVYRYGKRLEGLRKCQAQAFYMPWFYDKQDEPLETFFEAPVMANDYGIGTFELRHIIDWVHDCYKSGLFTESGTGLPLSKIGTRVFLDRMLSAIINRQGLGEILSQGIIRAADNSPAGAKDRLKPEIGPVGNIDMVAARAFKTHALLCPMEPRMSQPIVHENGFLYGAWLINQAAGPEASPVTTGLFHNVASAFWGSERAGDVSSYENKALAAVRIQNRTYIKDCLGLCDFAWPITYSFNTPDNMGDPDLEARIFEAVTGKDPEELDRYGDIIFNLQRAISIREGRQTPEDDYPQSFNFDEPLSPDRPFMVPGPGDSAVDVSGTTLDRGRFALLLKEYYSLRGWDEESGLQGDEMLASLGIRNGIAE